jgi:proteasome lid subunit RPN8/RPN11
MVRAKPRVVTPVKYYAPPPPPLQVTIPEAVMRRLRLYVQRSPLEVSGLGEVVRTERGLHIQSVHLLDQEVTADETELSALTVAQFLAAAPTLGVKPENVRLWWHSHGSLEAYWSSRDVRTIKSFAHVGWWLSIVANHLDDFVGRLDRFTGPRQSNQLTREVRLLPVAPKDEIEAVDAELAQRVRVRSQLRVTDLGPGFESFDLKWGGPDGA